MANPLDAYATKFGPRTDSIRIDRLPKLADLLKDSGKLSTTLAQWDNLMEAWRARLERQLQQPQQPTATVAAPTTTTTTATLSDSDKALLNGTKSDVDALQKALNDHIASKIVHGTVSNVVGVSDEQALNAKTIGEIADRNARFNHMLQRNSIPLGEDYTIPENFNMVVAGPFTVEGTLTIEGQFASVASS